MENLCALILAAGKGTRMVSSRAKVLHKVCGTPMINMVYQSAARMHPDEIFVVIGQDAENVRAALCDFPARFVLQETQLGTGHAVKAAEAELKKRKGDVLTIVGDAPRIKTQTLQKLVDYHRKSGAVTTLLTSHTRNPFGYGRILRNADGDIEAIVEEKDATPAQREIREINPGFYCFQITPLMAALQQLSNDNAQGEYYITDIVALQRRDGKKVAAILHEDFDELRGINSRRELADLSLALGGEKNLALMSSGVTMIDPERTYIGLDVTVEKDVTIYPSVTLEGNTHIGQGSVVRQGSRISNSNIGDGVRVQDSSIISDSKIGNNSTIGPFAHLRDGTIVGDSCSIGNYVEITRSSLGDGTKADHHTYLGDATVGRNVIIGAGAITCNYDGVSKNATIIEDDVFVGSDCQFVAPVKIGRGAYLAAGSTITEDVPPEALALSRARQVTKTEWKKCRRNRSKPDD
jgi:bifunctional UDP-N-acetylglucosamine pyrophosphorylase / glucosamine-1-phosphate N-acetyltransferase